MAEFPVLLVSGLAPRRDDKSPEADLRALGITLAWAEGHGRCGFIRFGQGQATCSCGMLAFGLAEPVTAEAGAA